jgi:pimeloyl-ACP methyl ester carboxylesterase
VIWQPYSTAGFERSVVEVDGVRCVIYAIGAGPTVVYFHGGGTHHGFEWAREWASAFRIVFPYHPNFGESGEADFSSFADYAAFHVRLLDRLGLERFHLVGASMGGGIAVEYASRAAAKVERLALVTPAGLAAEGVAPPDFSHLAPQDVPAQFVHDPKFIEPFWPREPHPAFLELRAREGPAAARLRENGAAVDARMRARLADLRMPTLIVWGDDDRVLWPALLPEWKRALPHAQSALIPDGAHLLLDESRAARDRLRVFLLQLEVSSS